MKFRWKDCIFSIILTKYVSFERFLYGEKMVNLIAKMVDMDGDCMGTVWRVILFIEILWCNHTLGKITKF